MEVYKLEFPIIIYGHHSTQIAYSSFKCLYFCNDY